MKNGNYVKIIKVIPINFNLKSNLEKESILNSYKIFLKTCNFDIQIIIQSNKEDLTKHINKIEKNIIQENNLIKNSKMNEITDLIRGLSEEYSMELFDNISVENKTGILSIDNLLEYFKLVCNKHNISYSVIVKTSIKEIIPNVIHINLLEVLISDMLNNSIIAINHSSTETRSILVKFDFLDCLQICIYDTGIPFEIDTLVKLGKERVTTHINDGGNGIGFFTTFRTLRKTNGSIVIEEYEKNKSKYSKCIIFKFDNKGEYIICSYRYKDIMNQSNGGIIIKPNP